MATLLFANRAFYGTLFDIRRTKEVPTTCSLGNRSVGLPKPHCLSRRNLDAQSRRVSRRFYTLETIDSAIEDADTFDEFRRAMEFTPHALVHSAIGGSIRSASGDMNFMHSPNDPIFWLHHSFIDYLWTRFLAAKQQKQGPDNPIKVTSLLMFGGKNAVGEVMTVDDKVAGFSETILVRDILDTKSICYEYSDPGMAEVAVGFTVNDPAKQEGAVGGPPVPTPVINRNSNNNNNNNSNPPNRNAGTPLNRNDNIPANRNNNLTTNIPNRNNNVNNPIIRNSGNNGIVGGRVSTGGGRVGGGVQPGNANQGRVVTNNSNNNNRVNSIPRSNPVNRNPVNVIGNGSWGPVFEPAVNRNTINNNNNGNPNWGWNWNPAPPMHTGNQFGFPPPFPSHHPPHSFHNNPFVDAGNIHNPFMHPFPQHQHPRFFLALDNLQVSQGAKKGSQSALQSKASLAILADAIPAAVPIEGHMHHVGHYFGSALITQIVKEQFEMLNLMGHSTSNARDAHTETIGSGVSKSLEEHQQQLIADLLASITENDRKMRERQARLQGIPPHLLDAVLDFQERDQLDFDVMLVTTTNGASPEDLGPMKMQMQMLLDVNSETRRAVKGLLRLGGGEDHLVEGDDLPYVGFFGKGEEGAHDHFHMAHAITEAPSKSKAGEVPRLLQEPGHPLNDSKSNKDNNKDKDKENATPPIGGPNELPGPPRPFALAMTSAQQQATFKLPIRRELVASASPNKRFAPWSTKSIVAILGSVTAVLCFGLIE